MNCNDFETKITDLARGRLIADARSRALAHTAACRRCAARWRDEQQLTAGLRELAATFNDEQMPARGEAQLLAAFRMERRAVPAPKPARRRFVWAAAAAAVLIILVAFAAARFGTRGKPQPPAGDTQAQQSDPGPAPVAPPPVSKAPSTPDRLPAPRKQAVTPAPRRRLAPGNVPARTVEREVIAATTTTTASPAATPGDEPASEIATVFIPLVERRGLAQADSLQIVRVELPRSALVSFGLPMNFDRADQQIKADVLVGNDGVARAIRFVR